MTLTHPIWYPFKSILSVYGITCAHLDKMTVKFLTAINGTDGLICHTSMACVHCLTEQLFVSAGKHHRIMHTQPACEHFHVLISLHVSRG